MKIIWLFGLLPATSGIGHIIAGLLIRPQREQPQIDQVVSPPRELSDRPLTNPIPVSVTDHTTNLLERERINLNKRAAQRTALQSTGLCLYVLPWPALNLLFSWPGPN